MKRGLRRAGGFVIPLLLLVGCAGNPARSWSYFPRPPTEAVRARLGTVLVQSAGSNTLARLARPHTRGKAAALGALEGMAAVTEVTGSGSASGMAAGLDVVLVIAALPVGAVAGSIVGGIHGTPKAEIQAAEQALLKACAELNFQEAVRQDVAEAARKNTRHSIVTPAELGTNSLPRPDSLLEVNVLAAGLAGSGKRQAPLAMFLRVQVRLLSWPDRSGLYEHTWVHTSGARPFKEWAEEDARAFRQELSAASQAVAESIVEKIFLAYRPEPSQSNTYGY